MRILMLSVHTCPLEQPGTRYAGGMNIYVRNLASCFVKEHGIEVDIFTLKHKGCHKEISKLRKGIKVIHIPLNGKLNLKKEEMLFYTDNFSNKVLEFIKRRKLRYDLIHSHYHISTSVGEKIKETLLIPHIATFHTLAKIKALFGEKEPKEREENEMKVIKSVDQIVATTEFEKKKLVELYQANEEKISVVPGGVDLKLFKPRDKFKARKRLNLPQNKNIILFVGRLDPIKGLKTLVKAIPYVVKLLCKRYYCVQFVVAGSKLALENKISEEIKVELKKKQLSQHIKFFGSKPIRILPYFYSASDVTVIPSNYESFGLVALEAMACKSPVLASKVANLSFLIDENRTGVFFEREDERDLAKNIVRLLKDETFRNRISENAYKFAQEHNWCKVTDHLLLTYQQLIKL